MIGLERFSLYKNEDELKADLEQTNLVNCPSWNFLIQRDRKGEDGKLTDKFMNEMLFYAVKEEEPWEGLDCFIYDYRPVFYSNALACALLTLKYLSAEEVPFKELMCDKQKGETTKNNHGIDADVQRLEEKLDSFLKYENEILMSEGKENGYIQTMYPCRYKDDGDRMNLFEFKPIEYIGDQEERKSFLISTMSHIMRAFYDREPYEPTGEPQSFWASVIDSTVLSTQ